MPLNSLISPLLPPLPPSDSMIVAVFAALLLMAPTPLALLSWFSDAIVWRFVLMVLLLLTVVDSHASPCACAVDDLTKLFSSEVDFFFSNLMSSDEDDIRRSYLIFSSVTDVRRCSITFRSSLRSCERFIELRLLPAKSPTAAPPPEPCLRKAGGLFGIPSSRLVRPTTDGGSGGFDSVISMFSLLNRRCSFMASSGCWGYCPALAVGLAMAGEVGGAGVGEVVSTILLVLAGRPVPSTRFFSCIFINSGTLAPTPISSSRSLLLPSSELRMMLTNCDDTSLSMFSSICEMFWFDLFSMLVGSGGVSVFVVSTMLFG
uniref:Uncharacterized protein n=1 Tax=Anopheles merus TaxID=30066 RepID=A0A182VE89_ANOME